MVHFTTRSFALLIMNLALLSALALPATADPGGNAANAAKCEKGGYLDLTDAEGNAFENVGECVRYAAQGGTLVLTPCAEEALSAGYDPAAFNLIAGTDGDDYAIGGETFIGNLTFGPDLICGFGGNDHIFTLPSDDIFLGGDGIDDVYNMTGGTFEGGSGDDMVEVVFGGTFNGGLGNDRPSVLDGGTFNGDEGEDRINIFRDGTFNGGLGNDWVLTLDGGIFNGGFGDDHVGAINESNQLIGVMNGGVFNGDEGTDTIYNYQGGDYTSVESVLVP